jgi:hypothetical protein
MSVEGQKAKYSPRAHVVRFAPDNGLKSDIAGGPFRANSDMVRLLENERETANRGGLSCFYYGRTVGLTLRSAIMESGELSPRDRPL